MATKERSRCGSPRSTQLVHEYTCAHAAGEVMGGRQVQGFRWDLDSVEVQTVYVCVHVSSVEDPKIRAVFSQCSTMQCCGA